MTAIIYEIKHNSGTSGIAQQTLPLGFYLLLTANEQS